MLIAFVDVSLHKKNIKIEKNIVQFIQTILNKAEHSVKYITDNCIDTNEINNLNVEVIQILSRTNFLQSFSKKNQVKKFFNKRQTDVIVEFYPYDIITRKSPNCIFLHDLPSKKEVVKLSKANKVLVFTEYLKNTLVEQFLFNKNLLEVIQPIVSTVFKPIGLNEIEQVKDGYADGRNYFLCNYDEDSQENLISILKAFAQFKKWQKTNMKLMVVCRFQKISLEIQNKISTFKFKEDVVVIENCEDERYALLLASAYGFIHTSKNKLHIFPLVEAVQTNTAIITINNDSFKEIIADAALFLSDDSMVEISNALQELYKNENLRSQLIEQTKYLASNRNIEETVQHFWQIVQKATQV
jgi:glycosyltransferase involved in cell wall biosynthesis